MEISVVSIMYGEMIPPNRTYEWRSRKHRLAVVETGGPAVLAGGGGTRLEVGDVVVCGELGLINADPHFLSIRGFVLHLQSVHPNGRLPVVIRRANADRSMQEVFDHFSPAGCPQTLLDKIHQALPHLRVLLNRVPPQIAPADDRQPKTGAVDQRLIFINRYIRTHFSKPLTLQLLADLIQCHPTYLSNTYSRVFGTSPMKYLQQYRMKKAKQWLAESDVSVGELAERLGYVSASQFTDLFKKHFAATPTQYRMEVLLSQNKHRIGGTY